MQAVGKGGPVSLTASLSTAHWRSVCCWTISVKWSETATKERGWREDRSPPTVLARRLVRRRARPARSDRSSCCRLFEYSFTASARRVVSSARRSQRYSKKLKTHGWTISGLHNLFQQHDLTHHRLAVLYTRSMRLTYVTSPRKSKC